MKKQKSEKKVIEDFGMEWVHFDQSSISNLDKKKIFDDYFKIFPKKILNKHSIGFDAGCGTGRWSYFVAPLVKKMHCIDPSNSINIAKKNLKKFNNCKFYKQTILKMKLPNNSMDFGFSLGVLHHTIDVKSNLNNCVDKLKKDSPFLLYLYYKFENKPMIYKIFWQISDIFRKVISRLPFALKVIVCNIIAIVIYFPLAKLCMFMKKFNLKISSIPLYYYHDKPFYVMKNDSLDRFGTTLEKRFSQKEIREMMLEAGLKNIKFSKNEPYWVAIGYK